ncbi:hypothetical protein MDS_2881 [Ectopseudomonas mendocina NK-01]|nr:hypothetical protein MDS_2881 [Pseudomonas mendocina NK-01]
MYNTFLFAKDSVIWVVGGDEIPHRAFSGCVGHGDRVEKSTPFILYVAQLPKVWLDSCGCCIR